MRLTLFRLIGRPLRQALKDPRIYLSAIPPEVIAHGTALNLASSAN